MVAIAAPTMPASLSRVAGTILARTPVSSGTHFSASLLIPPLAVFWRLTGALRYRVRFA